MVDDVGGPATRLAIENHYAGWMAYQVRSAGFGPSAIIAAGTSCRSLLVDFCSPVTGMATEHTRVHDATARPEGWCTVRHDQHPAGLRCGSISANTGAGKPAAVVGKYSRRSMSTTSMARSSGSRLA